MARAPAPNRETQTKAGMFMYSIILLFIPYLLVLVFGCPFFFDSLTDCFPVITIPATGSVPTASGIASAIVSHIRIPENDGYTHTPAHTNVIGYELLFVAQYYFPLIFLSQPYQDFLLLLGVSAVLM